MRILHRDERLLVVDKPPGLLVHRSALDRGETRYALQQARALAGRRLWPVHRLDKATSGLLLFALDADAARCVGGQFERQEIAKRYLAVVRGWPDEAGLIDHPLIDDDDPAAVAAGVARAACTRWWRLATVELPYAVDRYPTARYALLSLAPLTGRRHQLRRHLKHIAHPIVGDTTHGKGSHNRFFREHYGCARLLLACVGMRLRHPDDGRPFELVAAPGDDYAALASRLGWSQALATSPFAAGPPA
jgi:tRNA pseudouridine65 synthase